MKPAQLPRSRCWLSRMKYRVSVDRSLCIACGIAPSLCPQVFEPGEDNGKTRIVHRYSEENSEDTSAGVIPKELYDCVEQAAEACPVQAITVEGIKE